MGAVWPDRGKMFQPVLRVTLMILLGTLGAIAQQPSVRRPDGSQITSSRIDATMTQLMQAAHVTGCGIAIFHDSKITYLKTYGLRDVEKRLPLTPDSVMTSASLSKAAFATLVMRLVQEGERDLDKPIDQ